MCSQRDQCSSSFQSCNYNKYIGEVDAQLLSDPLCHTPRFMFLHRPIKSELCFVNPLYSNYVSILWMFHQLPTLIFLNLFNHILHCRSPSLLCCSSSKFVGSIVVKLHASQILDKDFVFLGGDSVEELLFLLCDSCGNFVEELLLLLCDCCGVSDDELSLLLCDSCGIVVTSSSSSGGILCCSSNAIGNSSTLDFLQFQQSFSLKIISMLIVNFLSQYLIPYKLSIHYNNLEKCTFHISYQVCGSSHLVYEHNIHYQRIRDVLPKV